MVSRRLPENFEHVDSRAAGLIGIMHAIKEEKPDVLFCDFGPASPTSYAHLKELRQTNPELAIVFCEITVFNRGWKKYSDELQFIYYDMGPKWDMTGINDATNKARQLVT